MKKQDHIRLCRLSKQAREYKSNAGKGNRQKGTMTKGKRAGQFKQAVEGTWKWSQNMKAERQEGGRGNL